MATTDSDQFYPAVSVIIPMYNSEKYIRECLDSLTAQTFTDFEVIVVDDCSTDSSPAIVESYAEKFGGRLTFVKRRKNFGGAALSRNMGINLARGEYIQLLDNDDFLSATALEELYTLAKKFDADVVYTGARYSYDNGKAQVHKSGGFTDKPVLEADASESLLQKFFGGGGYFFWTPWTKFVSRRLLLENEIAFPAVCSSEDITWTIEILCCSRRFLRVPNTVYYWRANGGSITRSKNQSAADVKFWVSIITKVTRHFENLWDKYDVLKKNPSWLYTIMNFNFSECFMRYAVGARQKLSSREIFEILRSDFVADRNVSDLQIPHLYSYMDLLHKQMAGNRQKFKQFAAQAQKKITELNNTAAQAQKRIAELEAQLKTK